MSVSKAVDDASESIRAASHLIHGDETVPEMYSILGDLRALADREHDFISKLNTSLNRLSKEANLRVDRDDIGSAEQLIKEVSANLEKAQAHLLEISGNLSRAHDLTSHIGQNTH